MPLCSACGSPVDENGAAIATATLIASAGLTENAAGALCYLGGPITGILFLVIAPYSQNPRIRFHAYQSILFSLVWTLAWLAIVVAGMILPFSMLLWGGGLLVWLLLLWKAYQGETLSLPVIGGIARQRAGKRSPVHSL